MGFKIGDKVVWVIDKRVVYTISDIKYDLDCEGVLFEWFNSYTGSQRLTWHSSYKDICNLINRGEVKIIKSGILMYNVPSFKFL